MAQKPGLLGDLRARLNKLLGKSAADESPDAHMGDPVAREPDPAELTVILPPQNAPAIPDAAPPSVPKAEKLKVRQERPRKLGKKKFGEMTQPSSASLPDESAYAKHLIRYLNVDSRPIMPTNTTPPKIPAPPFPTLNEALLVAVLDDKADKVEILLDGGADVHADNEAALRAAAKLGLTNMVKLLLDRGADIHAQNDEALNVAREKGHTETVALLEERLGTHPAGDASETAEERAREREESVKKIRKKARNIERREENLGRIR